mgnify:CR=1 FL=1
MTTVQENAHPLAAGYRRELETVWRKRDGKVDQHMVDWSLRDAEELIRLSDGRYYAISKPEMKTRFCFGYDTDFSGHEQSDAIRNEVNFLANRNRFKEENLRPVDDVLKALRDRESHECYVFTKYYTGGAIAGIQFVTGYLQRQQLNNSYSPLPDTDRTAITQAWERVRAAFEKRLDAYLKKYGTSKLRTWTYCRDD